jgi:hypothetical protein
MPSIARMEEAPSICVQTQCSMHIRRYSGQTDTNAHQGTNVQAPKNYRTKTFPSFNFLPAASNTTTK